ncbi:DUF6463 family protein [Sandaracinus amylolyticus]|uniref:Major facilitator superfamily (MFS) profile domain-containing protein n=1 Tax=Sandaracinus amylolyticus TaxID=927083 RepID=A0A0F6SHW3_9BACT|nr:DUF6463 family protein [Sandaracinus amylolyticus]AKF11144.1 hypothetical protein DB32_008293 [Sandaracinus amylolyticus]
MDHTLPYGTNVAAPPRVTVGGLLLAISAVHQIVGVVLGAAPLLDIARGGVLDAVEGDFARVSIAWFLLFGFALALAGALARSIERRGIALPRSFAVGLAALCALGIVLMPVSGFWLGLVPAWLAWRRAAP